MLLHTWEGRIAGPGNDKTTDPDLELEVDKSRDERWTPVPPLSSIPFTVSTLLLNVFGLNMHRWMLSRRSLVFASLTAGTAFGAGYHFLYSGPSYPPPSKETRRPPPSWTPPSRKEMLDALVKGGSGSEEQFDILVIGGGATGAGVAVDAVTRGLKVALVERDDFSSGA